MKRLGLLLSLCLLCTGCTATQVRDRVYIQAMELSDKESPSVQLHVFESEGSLYLGSGSTLAAALEQAEVPAGKELFLGHLELLCLHDPAFSTQLPKIMEEYQLSSGCKVVCPANNVSLESVNTERLLDSLNQEEGNGRLPETDLLSILEELSGKSGTALFPLCTSSGFSMAIVTAEGMKGALSTHANQGLCWLRGNNYPERVTVTIDGMQTDFQVHSASTTLSASMQNGIPTITVHISVRGKGDADALKAELETICKAAEQETVEKHRADVFGLEACMRQQCYAAYVEQDWYSLLYRMQFAHQFEIKTN